MDYKIFSSNRSILQSSAIHPIIATADKSGHFVPVGVTSAFLNKCLKRKVQCCLYNGPKPKEITNLHVFCVIYEFCNESKKVEGGGPFTTNFPSILIHRGMTEKTCEQFCQIAKRLSKSLFRRLFRFCKISISFLPITTLAIQNLVYFGL